MFAYRYRNIALLPSAVVIMAFLLSGCASYNRIRNVAITEKVELLEASDADTKTDPGDLMLFLAFSGGGTRAAAFSYGVLEELRDTRFTHYGNERRLLDEVDVISSVSGGSFTAAYYGLFGDRIFDDYEDVFLKKDVQKLLIHGLLNPVNWFRFIGGGFDRTEMAIGYYDREIFRGATFADIAGHKGPQIQINATDLSIGQRFSFTPERFEVLCSDLSEFKVARAVAASSAVPVAFAPIVLENFDTCQIEEPAWLIEARKRADTDPRLEELVRGLDSHLDKKNRRFIHLVDGGISDNLGLRSPYDLVNILGGAKQAAPIMLGRVPRILAIIVVNSQTSPDRPMDLSSRAPKTGAVVSAVSSTHLQRFNVESLALMQDSLRQWASELSTPDRPVTPYFIHINFEGIADPDVRIRFNNVATSLALPSEEVDHLTEAGRRLLQQAPGYRELIGHIRSLEQNDKTSTSASR
jgi:NTE family protein